MAKIICVTSGLTGILNASFELVNRLEKLGHQIIYASPRKVGDRVGTQGIQYVQLPEIELAPKQEVPNFQGKFKKWNRLKYKFKHTAKLRQQAFEKIDPKEFDFLLSDAQPDLLILDVELHEYIFKAYAKKVPMVLLSQWFSLWNKKGLPYLLHDTIPGKGWRGKSWMISMSWEWIKLKRWMMFTKKNFISFGTDRRSVLLALAKKENFPLKWIRENYWPGPFTYDQLPVISMTIQEMEFPHDIRPNLFYIGSMIHENRVEASLGIIAEKKFKKAFIYKKERQANLIYCSVSTLSKGDKDFIKKLIEAVRNQEMWVLIISLGKWINEKDLGKIPENIFTFSKVPQLQILKNADCSINHGGIHTINECIHFKVPMLIYSGKRSDQNGCAARVAYHQLGIMADKDIDTPETIRSKIGQVLENEKYLQNISTMHQHYLDYKKRDVLQNQIEKYLKQPVTKVFIENEKS